MLIFSSFGVSSIATSVVLSVPSSVGVVELVVAEEKLSTLFSVVEAIRLSVLVATTVVGDVSMVVVGEASELDIEIVEEAATVSLVVAVLVDVVAVTKVSKSAFVPTSFPLVATESSNSALDTVALSVVNI